MRRRLRDEHIDFAFILKYRDQKFAGFGEITKLRVV